MTEMPFLPPARRTPPPLQPLPTDDHLADAGLSIRKHLIAGVAISAAVVLGLGGWAVGTDIAGAVISQGTLVVDSSTQKVQHVAGGIVGEILVRDGDRVKAGDVVLRLDATQAKASLAIVTKGIDDLMARQARLEAERDGTQTIHFPQVLLERAKDPASDAALAIAGEQRQLKFRRDAREGQKAQLAQRIAQLKDEISGYAGQIETKGNEVALIKRELEGVRELWRKNLTSITRLNALERDSTRIEGDRSQLTATIAQARGKITETEIQIIQVDQEFRSKVASDLSEARSKLAELIERRIAAEDLLKHIDIRAPRNGVVHELAAHTVGGVITAGQTIMTIVPDADTLIAETKIAPRDISHVHSGQNAVLRFSAFDQRSTPEFDGKVILVSPDITQDPRNGVQYYTIRVALSPGQDTRLEGRKLVAGMPVEAFIHTGTRSVISYLVKPIADQAARAFRE